MKKNSGFTLIELLVVLSAIAVLASLVIVTLKSAREKAKYAQVAHDLIQIRNAISLMTTDTGQWPNGCAEDSILANEQDGNEVNINKDNAGLLIAPTAPMTSPPPVCMWTPEAANAWHGPYLPKAMKDPWGNDYWFDNDYFPRRDCKNGTIFQDWDNLKRVPTIAVVLSSGPNGIPYSQKGLDWEFAHHPPDNTNYPLLYDCDDIYLPLTADSISN